MVVTCEIEFEQNPHGTYFAGQLVSGSAILKNDKNKDVKAVQLKISGYALTRWRERRFSRTRTYMGREDYMESVTYLMGSDNSNKQTIHAGIHTYNFTCQLPYNCPSSFEGLHGCIRYVVKVVLVRPWKFDQTYSRGFTVLKMLDLNYEPPQLKIPSNSENYKTFCCGPCKTEPLKLQLRVPQTGYVPGQRIPVNVLVINNTNIAVAEVNFSLVMLVRYFSQVPPQNNCVQSIIVTSAKGESVLRNCTRSLTQELLVPAIPPTCLRYCSIIKIAYHIEVETKMKGWHGHQTITMPVTIGNVPLWNSAPGVVQQQPRSNQQQLQDTEYVEGANKAEANLEDGLQTVRELPVNANQTPTDIYPDIPPPSYEESSHTERGDINEDELHAFGRCEFAPLYPVYRLPELAVINQELSGGGYDNKNFEGDKL